LAALACAAGTPASSSNDYQGAKSTAASGGSRNPTKSPAVVSRKWEYSRRWAESIGVERLRDPPTEWSRQFEALGLNPE
jgi:hypothetical protein